MSSIARKNKRTLREKKEEKQGKQILFGFAIAAIVLVVLMFMWYSQQ